MRISLFTIAVSLFWLLLLTGCATHFERGKKLYNEKSFAKAKTEFEMALKEDPGNRDELKKYLSQIYFKEENYPKALENIHAAYKAKPSRDNKYLFLEIARKCVRNLIDRQGFDEAELIIADYAKRCDLDFSDLQAEIVEATIAALVAKGKFDKALKMLTENFQGEERSKRECGLLSQAVISLHENGDDEEALPYLKRFETCIGNSEDLDKTTKTIISELNTFDLQRKIDELISRNDYIGAAELYRESEEYSPNVQMELLVEGFKKNVIFANEQAKNILKVMVDLSAGVFDNALDRIFLSQFANQIFQLIVQIAAEYLAVGYEYRELTGIEQARPEKALQILVVASELSSSRLTAQIAADLVCKAKVVSYFKSLLNHSESSGLSDEYRRFFKDEPDCAKQEDAPLNYYTALALARIGDEVAAIDLLLGLKNNLLSSSTFHPFIDGQLSAIYQNHCHRSMTEGSPELAFSSCKEAIHYTEEQKTKETLDAHLQTIAAKITTTFWQNYETMTAKEIIERSDRIVGLDPEQGYIAFHRAFETRINSGAVVHLNDAITNRIFSLSWDKSIDSARLIEASLPDYMKIEYVLNDKNGIELGCVFHQGIMEKENKFSLEFELRGAGKPERMTIPLTVKLEPAEKKLKDIVLDYFTLHYLLAAQNIETVKKRLSLTREEGSRIGRKIAFLQGTMQQLNDRFSTIYQETTQYVTLTSLMRAAFDQKVQEMKKKTKRVR